MCVCVGGGSAWILIEGSVTKVYVPEDIAAIVNLSNFTDASVKSYKAVVVGL